MSGLVEVTRWGGSVCESFFLNLKNQNLCGGLRMVEEGAAGLGVQVWVEYLLYPEGSDLVLL